MPGLALLSRGLPVTYETLAQELGGRTRTSRPSLVRTHKRQRRKPLVVSSQEVNPRAVGFPIVAIDVCQLPLVKARVPFQPVQCRPTFRIGNSVDFALDLMPAAPRLQQVRQSVHNQRKTFCCATGGDELRADLPEQSVVVEASLERSVDENERIGISSRRGVLNHGGRAESCPMSKMMSKFFVARNTSP